MLVFLEESGDPGFQPGKGSSLFFVVVMVIFDDVLEAEKTAVAIKELRRKLKFPDTVEFKFHKSRDLIRKKFLQTAAPFKFRVRALVIEKGRIRSPRLKVEKEAFFNYITKLVLKHHGGTVQNAKLRFDRRGEKAMRNKLRVYLSRELDNKKSKIFKDLKFVDSRENVLIQLADMVAGAIYARYKHGDKSYLSILRRKRRIQDIWEFK